MGAGSASRWPLPSRSPQDAADILLPHKGVSGLAELIAVGRAHSARLENDYRTVYATNLSGVAGALLAGFASLHVGLLSNFGTGIVYMRATRGRWDECWPPPPSGSARRSRSPYSRLRSILARGSAAEGPKGSTASAVRSSKAAMLKEQEDSSGGCATNGAIASTD